MIEILVLNGSPGAGKSTIANTISDLLEKQHIAHAVVDYDELGRIEPSNKSVHWKNLKSILENYSTVSGLEKIIIPIAIDSEDILNTLKNCLSEAKWIICELIADRDTLIKRVSEREPNDYWREKLKRLVNNYADRDDSTKFGDTKIRTDNKNEIDTAKEIIEKIGWDQ